MKNEAEFPAAIMYEVDKVDLKQNWSSGYKQGVEAKVGLSSDVLINHVSGEKGRRTCTKTWELEKR